MIGKVNKMKFCSYKYGVISGLMVIFMGKKNKNRSRLYKFNSSKIKFLIFFLVLF